MLNTMKRMCTILKHNTAVEKIRASLRVSPKLLANSSIKLIVLLAFKTIQVMLGEEGGRCLLAEVNVNASRRMCKKRLLKKPWGHCRQTLKLWCS